MTLIRIVIAGGGPAAVESAVAARKTNASAEIIICSAEDSLPYRRPALSGLLAAGKSIDPKTFYIKPAEFFAGQDIIFRSNASAAAVDGSELIFADGEKLAFDKLIIACGSNAVRLPIPGAERAYTLRSLADMEKLAERLDSGVKSAVIIGGGVLGLEIAESLISRQISTEVIENAPQLFPGRLPETEAAALLERLNAIEFLHISCGKTASNISADTVELASGEVLPAEVVIFAAGSRPDLTLAKSAGLECGRGIVVNSAMQSSRENIFAAGDSAEFEGRCFNLYMDAMASGKVAGTNAAGGEAVFAAKPSPVRFMALGEKLVMP